ncbi:hypothetical protein MRB53_041088 [Persea americana]|nr:hypothetical protein MRB53_041088 [Persea americana]
MTTAVPNTNGTQKHPVVCVLQLARSVSPPIATKPTPPRLTPRSSLAAARALAHAFHEHHISLVYGGGTIGLMGELARTLVSLSGPSSVHGVIPLALMRYEAHAEALAAGGKGMIDEEVYGQTTTVKDMHERKALMTRLVSEGGEGSGFVALAGGFGTFEELMEQTTWNQLGIHELPVVVFNVEGIGMVSWRGSVKLCRLASSVRATRASLLRRRLRRRSWRDYEDIRRRKDASI